jgi:hypothetical protein
MRCFRYTFFFDDEIVYKTNERITINKRSLQRNPCRIKNVKHDGACYVVNERIQQHIYQLLSYYTLL